MKMGNKIALKCSVIFYPIYAFGQQSVPDDLRFAISNKPDIVCAFGRIPDYSVLFFNRDRNAEYWLKWNSQLDAFNKNTARACSDTGYYGLSDTQKSLLAKRVTIVASCLMKQRKALENRQYKENLSFLVTANHVWDTINKILKIGGVRADAPFLAKEGSKQAVDSLGNTISIPGKTLGALNAMTAGNVSARALVKDLIKDALIDKTIDEIMNAIDPFEYVAESIRQQIDNEFKDTLARISEMNEC